MRRPCGVGHDVDLFIGECPHQPQWSEHLHVLFVVLGRLAHALLTTVGDIEVEAETETFAQFQLLPYAGVCLLPHQDYPVHGPTFGGTTAYHAFDAMPGHKIHGPLRAALNGLPAR